MNNFNHVIVMKCITLFCEKRHQSNKHVVILFRPDTLDHIMSTRYTPILLSWVHVIPWYCYCEYTLHTGIVIYEYTLSTDIVVMSTHYTMILLLRVHVIQWCCYYEYFIQWYCFYGCIECFGGF